jgi:hypothetical protein
MCEQIAVSSLRGIDEAFDREVQRVGAVEREDEMLGRSP